MPTRMRGRQPETSTESSSADPATIASKASCGEGKTAMSPSPRRLTTCPRYARTSCSSTAATTRSSRREQGPVAGGQGPVGGSDDVGEPDGGLVLAVAAPGTLQEGVPQLQPAQRHLA